MEIEGVEEGKVRDQVQCFFLSSELDGTSGTPRDLVTRRTDSTFLLDSDILCISINAT